MKHRTEGHTETTISGDTRADWSGAFALVLSLQIAYVWHASKFTREVLDGLLRIGFEHHQQLVGDKGRTVTHADALLVPVNLAGSYGRRMQRGTAKLARTPLSGLAHPPNLLWAAPTKKSTITRRKADRTNAAPLLNHTKTGELVL
jgi:hypothetical protein